MIFKFFWEIVTGYDPKIELDTQELSKLFHTLQGDKDVNSPRDYLKSPNTLCY